MELKKATRSKVKLRLGLSSVSGGGKTYSALLLAHGLCADWSKTAVIDTENNSASLYSDLGDFNTIELQPPYNPERYVEAIRACEDAGMEVIIVDSITHEWDGKGGILQISDSMPGNSFANWAKLTPRHQSFIDAILQSKCHVITTVRRKQDYEMTKDANGKVNVQKLGLKEVTREGFEYEVTINFELDIKHNATASKDRTRLFMDKPAFIITPDTGKLIKQWCESGVDAPMQTSYNHTVLETKEKPLITNKTLKLACARLESGKEIEAAEGELPLYDKLLNAYSFEATQRRTLDASWQKGCIAADKLNEDANEVSMPGASDLPFNV